MPNKTQQRLKLPPEHCDLCYEMIQKCFVDGRTLGGPWANMCPDCHKTEGGLLGVGNGQKYERDQFGVFIKTGG